MNKAVVSFKVDSEIKEILQRLAEEDTRTFSNYLVTIIEAPCGKTCRRAQVESLQGIFEM